MVHQSDAYQLLYRTMNIFAVSPEWDAACSIADYRMLSQFSQELHQIDFF